MESSFYHIQLNIDFSENKEFYKSLFKFLGWDTIFETDEVFGFKSKKTGDIWFVDQGNVALQDYDARGLNHVAIRVAEQSDIDKVVEFLKENKIESLFETPRHRAEFASNENETYYQVMFKTKDNILFEIVYIGSKAD